jgi:phosphate acetyltransferase
LQNRSLYIASLEANSGSFSICLGMMELLKQNYAKVAFFKPVIDAFDSDIETMIERYALEQTLPQSYGMKKEEFLNSYSKTPNETYEILLQKYEALKQKSDFVLILGVSKDFLSKSIEYDINYRFAKNFAAPFVAVLNATAKSKSETINDLHFQIQEIQNHGCEVFATFVNMVEPYKIEPLRQSIDDIANVHLIARQSKLEQLSVSQIKEALGAKQPYGKTRSLKKLITKTSIAAQSTDALLENTENGEFIVTHVSRIDIVLALIAAAYSKNASSVSGILLVGEEDIAQSMDALIKGYDDLMIPILQVAGEIYEIIYKIKALKPVIGAKNKDKIETAIGVFFDSIDPLMMQKRLLDAKSDVVTPLMFSYGLMQNAKRLNKTVVLPESDDERILQAASIVRQKEIANVILIGEAKEILHKGSILGVELEGIKIINPNEFEDIEVLANNLYKKRAHKGLSFTQALDLVVTNSVFFATSLVDLGYADAMVSGAVNSTADTIRPALQLIKTKEGTSVVSSVFFICLDTKVLVYGDCAINKDPSAQELADIAISSAQTAAKFGIEPKIAMLSYSSGDSGSGAVVEKVKQATQIVKQTQPDLQIEGPIQYDAAIDADVAKKKLPHSKVAGHANVFVFPDLNSGNNTYKAVQRSTGALAIGPVLQGLNKPVNDLSRGCSVEDIVNTVAITAIQAGE